jgi:hypothetical protein
MENTKMIQILCENAKVWHKNDHPILYFLPSPIHPAFCYQGCLVKDHLILTARKVEKLPSGNSLMEIRSLQQPLPFSLPSDNSPPQAKIHSLSPSTLMTPTTNMLFPFQ